MNPFLLQSLIDRTLSRYGPPIAASCFVLAATQDFSSGLLTFASMVFVDGLLRVRRYPLHLVPLARYSLSVLLIPAAGIALVLVLSRIGLASISLGIALLALGISCVAGLAALWLGDQLVASRPIRTAIIGDASFARRLAAELADNKVRSHELVGYVDDLATEESKPTLHRLGAISEIRSVVQTNRIDLLVVAPEKPRLQIFAEVAKACLDLRVRMIEATALYESVLGHVPIGVINAAWFQYIMHPLYSPSSPLSKRLLDIVVSSAMLVFAAPVMAICALAIRLEDRGPVLYRQRRIGEEGREFDMIKFRTLLPDADRLLADGSPETEVLTRAGRILRKGHLNELPQLFQVLRGEMSLVGPRPEPPELVRVLGGTVPHYSRRALVKPGLTGWAQVRCGYAGSRIGTAWKTCHDLYYIKHRSVILDLVILLQTFPALIERHESERVPAPDFILGDTAAELIAR